MSVFQDLMNAMSVGGVGNQLLTGAGEYFLGRENIQDVEEALGGSHRNSLVL